MGGVIGNGLELLIGGLSSNSHWVCHINILGERFESTLPPDIGKIVELVSHKIIFIHKKNC